MQRNYYKLEEEYLIEESDWVNMQTVLDPEALDILVSEFEVKDDIFPIWSYFPVEDAYFKREISLFKPICSWNNVIFHTFFFTFEKGTYGASSTKYVK